MILGEIYSEHITIGIFVFVPEDVSVASSEVLNKCKDILSAILEYAKHRISLRLEVEKLEEIGADYIGYLVKRYVTRAYEEYASDVEELLSMISPSAYRKGVLCYRAYAGSLELSTIEKCLRSEYEGMKCLCGNTIRLHVPPIRLT